MPTPWLLLRGGLGIGWRCARLALSSPRLGLSQLYLTNGAGVATSVASDGVTCTHDGVGFVRRVKVEVDRCFGPLGDVTQGPHDCGTASADARVPDDGIWLA